MKNRSHHYSSPTAIKSFYLVCLPSVSEIFIQLLKWEKPPISAYHTRLSDPDHLIFPLRHPLSAPLHRHLLHIGLDHWFLSALTSPWGITWAEFTFPPPSRCPSSSVNNLDELFAVVQITRLSWLQTFISVVLSPWKIQVFILLTLSLCISIAFSR